MSDQDKNQRALTLGEQRCHINLNPSSDDKIGQIKRKCADLIDLLNEEKSRADDPEAARCFAVAMTDIETAQMYGVKGVAKGLPKN